MQRPLPVTVVTGTPMPPQASRLVPVPRVNDFDEPFRGHRFRLIRLLYAAGLTPPARPPGSRQRAASSHR